MKTSADIWAVRGDSDSHANGRFSDTLRGLAGATGEHACGPLRFADRLSIRNTMLFQGLCDPVPVGAGDNGFPVAWGWKRHGDC